MHAGSPLGNGFQLTIAPDRGAVARANAAFTAFAEANAVPASLRRSLNVALDELLQNTIAHGFTGRQGGTVTIAVELRTDRLTVTLTDDGRPFDPLGTPVPDTAGSVEERPVGGLGIHLVRQLMDEVRYQRDGDRNVVTLVKRLEAWRTMEIATRTLNDVTLVSVAGSLDSNSSPLAQQTLDGILASGARKIVIDLSGVDYISSAGLRVMLAMAKRLNAAGALRLFGLNETVREVFDISGFSTILAVYATEADALKGL